MLLKLSRSVYLTDLDERSRCTRPVDNTPEQITLDWCLSFLQHLEHSSSDFWDTLVHNICNMYEAISKIVISEKPMQRPRIPPQLAMNQIIGTWKNTDKKVLFFLMCIKINVEIDSETILKYALCFCFKNSKINGIQTSVGFPSHTVCMPI